jgi:hypothetical protein
MVLGKVSHLEIHGALDAHRFDQPINVLYPICFFLEISVWRGREEPREEFVILVERRNEFARRILIMVQQATSTIPEEILFGDFVPIREIN